MVTEPDHAMNEVDNLSEDVDVSMNTGEKEAEGVVLRRDGSDFETLEESGKQRKVSFR
jgi:hypothetical protein